MLPHIGMVMGPVIVSIEVLMVHGPRFIPTTKMGEDSGDPAVANEFRRPKAGKAWGCCKGGGCQGRTVLTIWFPCSMSNDR